jgi:hypothetical protein
MYEPLALCAWCSQGVGSHHSFVRDHNSDDYHVSPKFKSMHAVLSGADGFQGCLRCH